jgi:hypothetical protein
VVAIAPVQDHVVNVVMALEDISRKELHHPESAAKGRPTQHPIRS